MKASDSVGAWIAGILHGLPRSDSNHHELARILHLKPGFDAVECRLVADIHLMQVSPSQADPAGPGVEQERAMKAFRASGGRRGYPAPQIAPFRGQQAFSNRSIMVRLPRVSVE